MSYDAEEISVQSGAPIELYTFSHGVSTWRYTSSEAAYLDVSTSPNRTFTSAAIDRDTIEATNEEARNALQLTVPRDLAVAELFRVAPPSAAINVSLRRVHRGDTASPVIAWVGRVLNCTFSGAKATLQCEPITRSLARSGLRRLYGRSCPHVLYGASCGVVKTDYDAVRTVVTASGVVLTIGALPAYAYGGGYVEWVNGDGNTERRFIESHEYTTTSPIRSALTLMQQFAGISGGQSVTVYPGCDHTLSTCNTQYSNSANYGGFPFIPQINPFESPVF